MFCLWFVLFIWIEEGEMGKMMKRKGKEGDGEEDDVE